MFVTVKEFDELKKKLEEVETRMKGFEEALAKMKDSDTQNIRRVQLEPVSLLSPAHSSFARHCDSGSTHTSESEILSVIPSRRHVDHDADLIFFPLSRLPREIRWKVFGFLTTSIGAMRLVSKSWFAMINEWAIPENLPTLLQIDITEVSENCMNVGIEFAKREAACFGMLRVLAEELENFPERPQSLGNMRDIVRFSFDIPYGAPELERLRSCISTKSTLVEIARPKSGNEEQNGELSDVFYGEVAKVLEPLKQATQLKLFQHYINNDNSILLMDLTGHISVRKIRFTVDVQTYPHELLKDLGERVEYFNIRLVNSQARDVHDTSSVHYKSASWVEMILAMFHSGACSIYLDTYRIDLFSSEDMGSIVEVLVNRGSPFHMKADLHQEPTRVLAKAVKHLRKDITKCGNTWRVNISSKPPPAHAELRF